jgi:hypothetical protein
MKIEIQKDDKEKMAQQGKFSWSIRECEPLNNRKKCLILSGRH